jgi:hypothetical protein
VIARRFFKSKAGPNRRKLRRRNANYETKSTILSVEETMSSPDFSPHPGSASQPALKNPASEKKIEANSRNSLRSSGPKDTTATRFNAVKHGLVAAGVTELDDAEGYQAMLSDLTKEKNPVGPVEVFLVESATLDMIRSRRARRLEAEFITAALNPPTYDSVFPDFDELDKGPIVDPGLPAPMQCENVQRLVCVFQRYETMISQRLFRTLHELERLQRIRQGERLPAPVAIDVNLHNDAQGLGPLSAAENAVEGAPSKPDDKAQSRD